MYHYVLPRHVVVGFFFFYAGQADASGVPAVIRENVADPGSQWAWALLGVCLLVLGAGSLHVLGGVCRPSPS